MGKGKLKSFYITKELNEWLRLYSFRTEKSQGQIIREALKEYRKKNTLTPFTDIMKEVQGKE